jgi:ribosomal protein L44E
MEQKDEREPRKINPKKMGRREEGGILGFKKPLPERFSKPAKPVR